MAQRVIQTIERVEAYLATLILPSVDHTERLQHVKAILAQFGNPQNDIRAIHIAGTSGKGSTAYYASSLLVQAGYSVGLGVSPHVNIVSERAQVNGAPLLDSEYVTHFNLFLHEVEVRNLALSYIEFLDVFMFWLFSRLNLDYMVIEVGLGGLLDPTNVMDRSDKVCVITDIGLDHTEILGNTLGAIAGQKAGIIHDHNDVVLYRQSSEVMDSVDSAATDHNAKLHILDMPERPAPAHLPSYQKRNWGLALAAINLRLEIDGRVAADPAQDESSAAIVIPGRFERITYKGVEVVLDAAHNPQKMRALAASLDEQYADRSFVYIVSFGRNKSDSFKESLEILREHPSRFVVTELIVSFGAGHDALPAESLKNVLGDEALVVKDPTQAFNQAVDSARTSGEIVVVTGSFYLIDTIRRIVVATR